MSDLNFFQKWVLDSSIGGAVDNKRDPYDREANTFSRILGGIAGVDVDKAVDMNTVDSYLKKNDLTRAEAGVGEDVRDIGQARVQAKKKQKSDARTERIELRREEFNDPALVDQRMRSDRRYYDTQKQLAQERLDRLAQIERSERREDRRYNERLELESKRDRRQAMQNLAAGLASLGAAFAL